MIIYVFGNPLDSSDSLSLSFKLYLEELFPDCEVIHQDPTDEFIPEDDSIMIDTIVGLDKITVFDNIDSFVESPRISVHDYDLALHLKLLKKLNKIQNIKIIGLAEFQYQKHIHTHKWQKQILVVIVVGKRAFDRRKERYCYCRQ